MITSIPAAFLLVYSRWLVYAIYPSSWCTTISPYQAIFYPINKMYSTNGKCPTRWQPEQRRDKRGMTDQRPSEAFQSQHSGQGSSAYPWSWPCCPYTWCIVALQGQYQDNFLPRTCRHRMHWGSHLSEDNHNPCTPTSSHYHVDSQVPSSSLKIFPYISMLPCLYSHWTELDRN